MEGNMADAIRKIDYFKAEVSDKADEGRYGAILWVKPGDVRKAAKALGAA